MQARELSRARYSKEMQCRKLPLYGVPTRHSSPCLKEGIEDKA